MHRLLITLLAFGVLVGLGERVMAEVGIHAVDVVVSDDHCGDHDHHPGDGHHDSDCPPGPHHHHTGACCSGVLTMEEPGICRLGLMSGLRIVWHHPDEAVPDGPFLAMDKPPLI